MASTVQQQEWLAVDYDWLDATAGKPGPEIEAKIIEWIADVNANAANASKQITLLKNYASSTSANFRGWVLQCNQAASGVDPMYVAWHSTTATNISFRSGYQYTDDASNGGYGLITSYNTGDQTSTSNQFRTSGYDTKVFWASSIVDGAEYFYLAINADSTSYHRAIIVAKNHFGYWDAAVHNFGKFQAGTTTQPGHIVSGTARDATQYSWLTTEATLTGVSANYPLMVYPRAASANNGVRTFDLTLQPEAARYNSDIVLAASTYSNAGLTATDAASGETYVVPSEYNTVRIRTVERTDQDFAFSANTLLLRGEPAPADLGDPDFASVKLLLRGEGTEGSTTATDSSNDAITMTAVGDAQITTAAAKFGSSCLDFASGVNGEFRAPDGACSVAGGQDFTVECWLYITYRQAGSNYNFVEFVGSAGTTRLGFSISDESGRITVAANYNFSTTIIPHQGTLPQNEWVHVAMVRASNVIHTYINGVKSTTPYAHSYELPNTGSSIPFNVGQRQSASSQQYYMDEFRLTVGVARYTADFTPPTTAFGTTATLTNIKDSSLDNRAYNNNYGCTYSSAVTKYNPYSLFFNASNLFSHNRLEYSNVISGIGTGPFTVECWIYMLGTSNRYIWQVTGTNGRPRLLTGLTGINFGGTNFTFGSAMSINTWYHLAICREGGVGEVFLDGVSQGTTTFTDSLVSTLYVGGDSDFDYGFYGYMDDFRVSRYVRYKQNFTPPTAALLTSAPMEVVGATHNLVSTVDNSSVVTVPTHAEGDLLVAAIMWREDGLPLQVPAGWTLRGSYLERIVSTTSGAQRVYVYTKTASASEPADYTWTGSGDAVSNTWCCTALRNARFVEVSEAYGNAATASITTRADHLNLLVSTWIWAFTTETTSFSGNGVRTLGWKTGDTGQSNRMNFAYTTLEGVVKHTHQATTADGPPNHGMICIRFAPA